MKIIIHIICFVAMVAINSLSNSLPLNGKTPGQLSDDFPNLFVPAGLTFAIWGIIYSLLIVWIGGQAYALVNQSFRDKINPHLDGIGWWFVASCVFNVAWLFAWHWSHLVLSLCIMIALLYTLVKINLGIRNGQAATSGFEKNIAHVTFGIYQGWITVALIANFTTLLVGNGWNGGSILTPEIWAITVILVGFLIAIWMVTQRNIPWHGLVVAWAFLGIYLKRTGLNEGLAVGYVAIGLAALLVLSAAFQFKKWLSY